MSISIMWFRRDLRLADNPALLDAIASGDQVMGVFVLDDALRRPSGAPRLAFLYQCLEKLNESMNGHLLIREGDPVKVLPRLAREVGADVIVCTEDFGPYGRKRDDDVDAALQKIGVELRRVDSAYAVAPGTVAKPNGSPYQVFTPFSRAWEAVGWGNPRKSPRSPNWLKADSVGVPEPPEVEGQLPKAGEEAARKRLNAFIDERLHGYKAHRNEPSAGATSRLSPYLKYGCLHPRQALAKLGRDVGSSTFRNEICWRDFYADVLFHRPDTVGRAYRSEMSAMKVDNGTSANKRFDAWSKGITGYPIVDAGMRQLLGECWVHNRVRMIVASFLIKDLHCDWTLGARYFMQHLVDGDIASNAHGWQWTAGTGTDAAPYFRVFNPVTQGEKFDPDGEYVKKWVPELRNVDPKFIHKPWMNPNGIPDGYPDPIVNHDEERKEALARYAALSS